MPNPVMRPFPNLPAWKLVGKMLDGKKIKFLFVPEQVIVCVCVLQIIYNNPLELSLPILLKYTYIH